MITKKEFKTIFFIAYRYLFRKQKHNLITIISIVSSVGIAVSSAALIIILSVFNGMEGLIVDSLNAVNPDIVIEIKNEKIFKKERLNIDKISKIKDIKSVEEVLSDIVLLNYEDKHIPIRLKGVNNSYIDAGKLNSIIVDGSLLLNKGVFNYGIIGIGAAGMLQLNLNSSNLYTLFYPERERKNLITASGYAFNQECLIPSAVFESDTKYDQEILFCNINIARSLMLYSDEISSVEIFLKKDADMTSVTSQIEKIAGDKFTVKDRFQQEPVIYKTLKSEKFMVAVVLSFILLIAMFNIIGSTGMLVIEKKSEFSTYKSLGAPVSLIRGVFALEEIFISLLGGLLGILTGSIAAFIQEKFHVVGYGANNIIDYYPIEIRVEDMFLVLTIITIISLIASFLPVYMIKKEVYQS